MGFERIRPINIIVGRNNSGKSTLLDACRIAFSADPHPDGIAITLSKIVSGKDVDTIPDDHREFRDGSLSSSRSPQRFCRIRVQDKLITAEQKSFDKYKFIQFQGPFDDLTLVDRKVFEFAGNYLSRTFTPLFTGWHWNAISSERNVVPETNEGSWIPQPNGSGTTRFVENLMNRAEANRVDLIETRLIPAMNLILGPDNIYERISLRRNGELWEVYLEEKTKGAIPISATGSGVKTVLQVLMNLTVYPEALNLSPSDCIFAFEELENNLHPATVRRLFSYLRSYCEKKKCHFFITTHSHIVIDMFSNDDLAQILHVTHDGELASVRTLESHSHAMGISVAGSDVPTTEFNFWSSISVGEDLPPANCELMLSERPNDAFGLLVFDAWIANGDRNEKNLTYNSIKKELLAFDHEQAICNNSGVNFLKSHRNSISFLDGHAVGYHIRGLERIAPWLDKIQAIPASVVLHAAKKFSEWLPDQIDYKSIASELVIRQKTLAYLFSKNQNNRELFPSIEKSLIEVPPICTTFPQKFEVEVPCDNDYCI